MKITCFPGMEYNIKGLKYKVPEHLKFTDSQYMIDQKVLDGLYDLLKTAIEIFNKNNIDYFAIDGTLLSVIRHKAFMPWDDDIDIGYFMEDHAKIKALKYKFIKKGYLFMDCQPGFLIQHPIHSKVAIDMHMVALDYKDNKYKYCAPLYDGIPTFYIDKLFPKSIYFENEIKELKEAVICDLNIKIPSNTENVLKRCYADNVLNEVRGVASTKGHRLRKLQFIGYLYEKSIKNQIELGSYILNKSFT